eukprot:784617-Pyramimonas_sp.AAC.1
MPFPVDGGAPTIGAPSAKPCATPASPYFDRATSARSNGMLTSRIIGSNCCSACLRRSAASP